MEKCNICEYDKLILVDFNNIVLRTDSKNKNLHDYKNYICKNCGVLNQHPQMDEIKLSSYYNSSYRDTAYKIDLGKKTIDFPLKFEQTGISFQRFFHFYKIINKSKIDLQNQVVLDYGSYQGSFLYACKKVFDSFTIAYDYNDEGLKFSKNYLELDEIKKTENIYEDLFKTKPYLCSLIHVFEHLSKPNKFLKHVCDNILGETGYIYIEVPDIYGNHFSDPTHCFTYSKESLKYVLEKNNFEVIHMETNRIYGKIDSNILRKKLQLNLHCLAKKNLNINFNTQPLIGDKIYMESKKGHIKIFNKLLFEQIKKIIRDTLDIMFLTISKIISLFSIKLSIYIYEGYKINLKKIINKLIK